MPNVSAREPLEDREVDLLLSCWKKWNQKVPAISGWERLLLNGAQIVSTPLG